MTNIAKKRGRKREKDINHILKNLSLPVDLILLSVFQHPTGGGYDTTGNKERKMAPLSLCNANNGIVNKTNRGN